MSYQLMAHNADRTGALRILKLAIGYLQIERKTEALSDADILGVIQTEAKKRRDAFEAFDHGSRQDLAAKEKAELSVLEEFLAKSSFCSHSLGSTLFK